MTSVPDLVFELYVAAVNDANRRQILELRAALAEHFENQNWRLEVIEVIDSPEIALANDIFATPTLVRTKPEPVVKVLNALAMIPEALQIIGRAGLQ